MTDVQPDYTPFLNLVRPDTHDDIRTTVNKLRDALDAVDAWAQAHAGGGGLSLARQVPVDSSTPSAPAPDTGGYLANDVDLVVVDNTDGGAPFIYLPDSPIGTAITVVRRDVGGTNQALIGVSTSNASSWGFLNQPDSNHNAANLADGEAKTYVSDGVSGWWFIDANNTLPPPFYGSDPNNIDWSGVSGGDGRVLAFNGYSGRFEWTDIIPGVTHGVLYLSGPVNYGPVPSGTRFVVANAQSGQATFELPSWDAGWFPSTAKGVGLVITVVKTDPSKHPVAIMPQSGELIFGEGAPPTADIYYLSQLGESVTLVAANGWQVLEHIQPGRHILIRTDNDSPLNSGEVCLCNTSIRSFQVNLPPEQEGARVTIKKISDDANTVSIYPNGDVGGVLIEGGGPAPYVLAAGGDGVTLICDGTNWQSEAVTGASASIGLALEGLSDVQMGSKNDTDMIQWNGTDNKWVNRQPADLGFVTIPPVGETAGNAGLGGAPVGSQQILLVDATTGAGQVTLPAPAASTMVTVKKIDSSANPATLVTPGTEKIDGADTRSLPAQYDSVTVVSDGANWFEI